MERILVDVEVKGKEIGESDVRSVYLLPQGVAPKQILISVNRSLPNVSLTSFGAGRNALSSVGPRGPCDAGSAGGT